MYNCGCCTTPSKPNQKVTKITLYVVVNNRRQIEKEIQVCPLCYEGYHKGIPLASLAVMHRPVSPQLTPASPAVGGSVGNFARPTEPHAPLAGASPKPLMPEWFPDTLAKAQAADREAARIMALANVGSTSPKEKRPPVLLGASKAEKLLAAQETKGKKPPKVKYENLKKRKANDEKRKQQAGGKVS